MDTTTELPRKQEKRSFIKFLIKDFSTRLGIPPFFTKNFGKYVQNKAVLNDSFGKSWEVEVKKIGKHFYFQKGWEKFVKDNTLEYGDFLMFKLSGNSTFKVKLYSKTCCEKEISVARGNGFEPRVAQENEIQEDKGHRKRRWVEVVKGIHMMEEEEEFDDGRISQGDNLKGASRVVNKFDEVNVERREVIQIGEDQIGILKQSMHKRRIEGHIVQDTAFISRSGKTTTLSPSKEVEFNSKYLYFRVELRPAYVKSSYLAIPKSFFKEHMKEEDQGAKLQISEKIWTIKISVSQNVGGSSYARLGTGWSKFVRDNGLKVGDVCIFEMVKTDEIAFHVHINRC